MQATVPTIAMETLRDWLAEQRPVTVLDVRLAADYADWHIPGSQHLDTYLALKAGDTTAVEAVELPSDRPVVTVCGAGVVSLAAAAVLARRGLDARSLHNGMAGWSLAWNVASVPVTAPGLSVLQVRRTGKGCLSYVIAADGEATVVDAALPDEVYRDLCRSNRWRITRVVDTHVHADHFSRGRALAAAGGADYCLAHTAACRVDFAFQPLRDGDRLPVGGHDLSVLETPGHTPDSLCFRLGDSVLLTGDTLFLDGVGRPDLHADPAEARQKALALHASLRRLFALPGSLLLLPGHTGSPPAFDSTAVTAALGAVRRAGGPWERAAGAFADGILERLPATPPNHAAIIVLNESVHADAINVATLEVGANRCAVR